MNAPAVLFYLFFSIASAYFTFMAVKMGATELNPIQRLLLRSPVLFWLGQIVFMGIVVELIVALGPWFAFFAVSARAMTAWNDYLVYRKLK
jgi:hypothetical protein